MHAGTMVIVMMKDKYRAIDAMHVIKEKQFLSDLEHFPP
jgi:hypothetical protein